MVKSGYSLGDIVTELGGTLIGELDVRVHRLGSLAHAKAGEITFVSNAKYLPLLAHTQASAVILSAEHQDATNIPRIVTDNPYAYFAKLSAMLNPEVRQETGIHDSAVIDATAMIPLTCSIGPNAVIGPNVKLADHVTIGAGAVIGADVMVGEHSQVAAGVVIYHGCIIGKNCLIASGTVIGADGFGYAEEDGRWVKIPQIGLVIIEDDVEIGANTTIDRGALDDTVIEQGAKLDNLIQIGHNCRIGAHTVIAGCTGIAGSARIGKHCKIGGAAMILGHLEIADGVTVSPGSMITRSIKKTDTYTALMPFQTHDEWLKTAAHVRRLGDMADRIKALEKKLSLLDDSKKKSKN